MAHVTVPSENSYVRYTSQTGTGPFAFTFTVFEKDDLEVRIDGSALATSAWTIAWDTSDDGGYTGGSITLNSSLTASSTVDIVSVMQAVRGTDFSSGSISPTSLNTELDKLTAMTRDLQRDMARTVRFDLADTTADLGKLSDNASKVVAVNSSGTALEFATNSGTGGGGSGSGNVSNTGTPLNNQVAVWTNATTIEGNSGLTWDGSTLAVTGSITDDGVAVPTISSTDTLSNKTLASPVLTTPQINDTSSNQQYIFAPSELTADRTVTLPLLTGNDTFVFQAHSQTLTNKTIAFGSNTVSGTFAEFNTAVTDATLLSTSSTATLTNKTFDLGGTGNVLTGSTTEFNTALQADSFAFLGSSNTFTGANIFTSGSMRVPSSATPTIAAQGDFALDTSVTNYAPGALRYHDGTNDMHVVAVAASVLSATPTNGHVLTYDATNDLFYLAAAPGAGGGVSGTGTNNAVAVWSGTGSLDFTSGFTFDGTSLTLPATMFMTEVAAAAVDVAGDGQIWVKNATPNELWFTTDAGDDIQITTGTTINALTASGTATLTNKTYDLGGAGNTLTGSKTEFNTALQSDTFVMGSDLGANVATFLATPSSANLAAAVTGESGTGALLFGTSPTIATPTLTLQDANGAAPTTDGQIKFDRTGETLEVGDGTGTKVFSHDIGTATLQNKTIDSANNTLTLDLSEGTLAGTKTEFNTALSADTFIMSSDLGTNVETFLGTPSSANLAAAVTGETGSGALVFGTSPTFTTSITTDPIFINESAAASADVAGDGQIWVKNATPNELWFTTDAGDDIQITSGTGISASGFVTASGTNAGSRVAYFTGDDVITDSQFLTYTASTQLGTTRHTSGTTNSVLHALLVGRSDSSTPTAGFGSGIQFYADNSALTPHEIATFEAYYTTVTAASEASDIKIYGYTAGSKTEYMHLDGANQLVDLPTGWQFAVNGTPLSTGITGTGANDRLAVWSGTGTQDSDANLTWDGSTLAVTGAITKSGNNVLSETTHVENGIPFGTANNGEVQYNSAGLGFVNTSGFFTRAFTGKTTTVNSSIIARHNTSGTVAAGFGTSIELQAENSAADNEFIGSIEAVWTDPTSTAEESDVYVYGVTGGAKTAFGHFDGVNQYLDLPAGWAFAVNGTPLSTGGISASGTPVNNQIAVWTDASTVEGDSNLTWDASTFTVGGALSIGTSNAATVGTIELGHASDTTLARASAGNVSVEGTLLKKVGSETIWVPATAMTARTTSGAASGSAESTTNKVMLETFDFDAATDEFVQFSVAFPKSWNAGTVTAQFFWSNASGAGNVVWACQAMSLANSDVLDTAFGTAQSVTDGVTTAGDLMVSAATSAITIAGTPGDDEMVTFQVYRDADNGSDTLAGDARLHGVKIIYTTDAANDD